MTRFERELSGNLGEYWRQSAEQELARLRKELDEGQITIDEAGVARNCIGRVVMNDLLERLPFVTDRVNVPATKAARDAEVAAELAEYRSNRHPPTHEELAEMRAAFGPDTKVVNVITGETIDLD